MVGVDLQASPERRSKLLQVLVKISVNVRQLLVNARSVPVIVGQELRLCRNTLRGMYRELPPDKDKIAGSSSNGR